MSDLERSHLRVQIFAKLVCTYVSYSLYEIMHMLGKLFRNVVPEYRPFSRQRLVFSIAKRLSTTEQHWCYNIGVI